MRTNKNNKRFMRLILLIAAFVTVFCLSTGVSFCAEEEDVVDNTTVIYNTAESPDALLDQDELGTSEDSLAGTAETEDSLGTSEDSLAETEDPDPQTVSPYVYQELLVFVNEGDLDKSYGAVNSVYCQMINCYILQYEDEQTTEEAYEALKKDLGEDKVMINLPAFAMGYNQNLCNKTPASSVSWGSDIMKTDTMRDKLNASSITRKVTVAIVDSGINKSHEMFSGRTILSKSKAFLSNSADIPSSSYDYYDDSNYGHGTHVAGIVADGTPNQVQFLIIKVFNKQGTGSALDTLQAFEYAHSCGVDIINFSGGVQVASDASESSLNELKKILQNYWTNGTLLVCSGGNDTENLENTKQFPAYFPYNISVSATYYDSTDPDFYFNLYGWNNCGEQLDFTAPGSEIVSASNKGNTQYARMSGTSMASPQVAAAAADIKLVNPKATPAELKLLLRAIAVHPMPSLAPDPDLGYGMPIFSKGESPKLIRTRKITLSATSFVYNGKARKPTVTVKSGSTKLKSGSSFTVKYTNNKKVGTARVTITGEGLYAGSITKKFTIKPKGTSLKKLSAGSKKLTVRWKKHSVQTSGYQIKLATNSKFTKGKKTVTVSGKKKVKKTITGLKAGKKYYVKIRTFKTVSGKKYFSAWSKVKTKKTN